MTYLWKANWKWTEYTICLHVCGRPKTDREEKVWSLSLSLIFVGHHIWKPFWLKRQNFGIDAVNSINLPEVLKRMTQNIWSDSFALKSSLFYYCCCFIIWWAQSCLMRKPMEISQKTDRAPQSKTWVDVWDCCINFLALPVSSRMASFSLWSIRDLP